MNADCVRIHPTFIRAPQNGTVTIQPRDVTSGMSGALRERRA